jgi:hypothetical protein
MILNQVLNKKLISPRRMNFRMLNTPKMAKRRKRIRKRMIKKKKKQKESKKLKFLIMMRS